MADVSLTYQSKVYKVRAGVQARFGRSSAASCGQSVATAV